jgi:hypothetical protein
MRTIYSILTATVAAMAVGADTVQPEFEFSNFSKAKDSVKAHVKDGKADFTVSSSDGIGKVTIKAKKGHWPRDVTVLINRSNLEQFTITTSRLWAQGSLKQSGQAEFSLRNAKGELEKNSSDGHYVRTGSLDIRVEKREKGIAIIFPPNLFVSSEKVEISWIDEFRR